MEFSSRNTHRVTTNRPVTSPAQAVSTGQPAPKSSPEPKGKNARTIKILAVVLFFSALVLGVAAIISLSLREREAAYVDKNQYQLVTLVDKQAYFGKITNISKDYIVLNDVYYINEGTSTDDKNAVTNTTLVKRGCIEIHKPQDQMILYRDQVDFWENLQSDSKVSQAITQFKKENPDKSKQCDKLVQQQEAATQQSNTDTTTNTTNTTNSTETTTPKTNSTNTTN